MKKIMSIKDRIIESHYADYERMRVKFFCNVDINFEHLQKYDMNTRDIVFV